MFGSGSGQERGSRMLGDAFGEVTERLRRITVQVLAGGTSRGSGVVWSGDGQVVTNAHVLQPQVGQESRIIVELWNGRRLAARVQDADSHRDLAALQVDADGLASAIPGDSDRLRPGELAIAVGSPHGFSGAVSTGVIHSVGALAGFAARPWVVSDVRLAPGNSGGPLANAQGEIIGLNTMIAGGLALAIPSTSVGRFLARVSSGRAYLGVTARPVPLAQSAERVVPRNAGRIGFLVLEIDPQSPAARASLLPGDLLVGAAGRPFHSAEELEDALHSSRDGQIEIEFRRGEGDQTRKVVAQVVAKAVRAA
jgi:serine protease Do